MPTDFKSKLLAHMSELSLAAVGGAVSAGLLAAESFLSPIVSQLTPQLLIRTVAALIALSAWSVALAWFFRPRLKFDTALGIYRDRKTGDYFCPSCHSKKLRSPLMERKSGWVCVVKDCGQRFANPEYKSPSPPPLITVVKQPPAWSAREW